MRSLLLKSAVATLLVQRSSASATGLRLRSWSTLAGARLGQSSQVYSTRLAPSLSDQGRIGSVLNSINIVPRRRYSPSEATAANLDDTRKRVLKVCAAFDKINADKLTIDSHFMNDLGLDSLDHVEVIMAIEDEFGFEIPDTHAEKLLKPADIVQYVIDKEREEKA